MANAEAYVVLVYHPTTGVVLSGRVAVDATAEHEVTEKRLGHEIGQMAEGLHLQVSRLIKDGRWP
jgi:hypothetical protein